MVLGVGWMIEQDQLWHYNEALSVLSCPNKLEVQPLAARPNMSHPHTYTCIQMHPYTYTHTHVLTSGNSHLSHELLVKRVTAGLAYK